jgi:hypothetical protein
LRNLTCNLNLQRKSFTDIPGGSIGHVENSEKWEQVNLLGF